MCAINLLKTFFMVSDLTFHRSFKVKQWRLNIKVPMSRLLFVLDVSNVQPTFRKPQAANLLLGSDLTFDHYFMIEIRRTNIKMHVTGNLFSIYCLLFVLEVGIMQSTFIQKTVDFKSFGGVRFNLVSLLPGQTMAAEHNSVCISSIIGHRDF